MNRDFEIVQPCLLLLFLATSITMSSTDFTKNFAGMFFEVSGREINDLIVIQNAEGFNSTMQDLRDKTSQTKILADIFETRIDKITHLLETTSEYPSIRNISYVNLIDTELMGIPEVSDIEKRNTAKYLLKNEPVLGGLYFTLPNGDVYLGEPYSAQKQLPRLNFADRDWYKGV